MSKHQLQIQEIPTGNCNTLRLADNSMYNALINVENAILEITAPGFDCATKFNVSAYFNVAYNSSTLNIAPARTHSELVPLPDGVYHIKYSVKPNDQVYVEYQLFRVCAITKKHSKAICALFGDRERITKKQFEERRKELIWVKELIDGAKYLTEECNSPSNDSIRLYNEASRILKKINDCEVC